MLRPGGTLVYCTCSLEPEERLQRIEALLGSGAPVERRPVEPARIGAPADWVTPQGDLRTLPCHLSDPDAHWAGLDGFYAARLERT